MEKNDTHNPPYVALVVDDDHGVRTLISTWLQLAGYTVLEAANGTEAIQVYATRNDITLLVTDIIMPEMDGFILAERLTQKDPKLRVIYMSGYIKTDKNSLPEAIWLRKPFGMEHFLGEVRRLLATGSGEG